MLDHLRKFDWLIVGAAVILCAISLLELSSIDAGSKTSNFFVRQLIFVLLGFGVMFLVSFLDCRMFRNFSSITVLAYLVSLAALVVVVLVGRKVRGMAGWFHFGDISFAPVELAKIVLILVLAKYFSGRHIEVYRIRHIIASGIYAFLPTALVLMQPDLGSALILIAIWFGIVLLSGMQTRHLIIVLVIGVIVASLAWSFAFKTYQKERIMTFLNPNKDPLGYSYNLIQSKIAIGSGQFWGKGLGHGSQGQLNFLPEKHTDFIFALFAEEWGFLGVLFLFGAFGVIFYRLMRLILLSSNNFFRLFIAGYAVMLFAHIFINVGMNLGVMPVTGIPLPFMSSGGSNLLANFIALGIIQNIAVQARKSAGQEFE